MKLYVGNLSRSVTEDTLQALFAPFGQVVSVKIIIDKFTGSPKGFGFVVLGSVAEGQAAIDALNGKSFEGQNLKVNKARPPQARPTGGNGGGRSYGGYNNNNNYNNQR
jgi:cold-inducible RNA-binding protein